MGNAPDYRIMERSDGAERVLILVDEQAGLTAEVIPGVGANCHRLRWRRFGAVLDLLRPAPSAAALRADPIRYGVPILFPYPNRVAGGAFTFGGRRYRLPVNEPERGNAIHGLVMDKPWQVAAAGADRDGAWVICAFASDAHPGVRDAFPFPFRATAELRLTGGRLSLRFQAENAGDEPMPLGFGIHPWFPAPLVSGGARADCRVQAPVSQVWELEDLIPTGRLAAPNPERDLRRGIALGELEFDDVYTGVTAEGPWEAVYADPAAGVELVVRSAANLRELVIYTTRRTGAVCLEPYSCATDAFNLEARGVRAGLTVLPPGAVWRTSVELIPRPLGG